MSHWSIPSKTVAVIQGSSGEVELEVRTEENEVPPWIEKYLFKMQWSPVGQCPNTKETLYSKNDEIHDESGALVNGTSGYYFRWYEACAYEHAKLMSIGLGE